MPRGGARPGAGRKPGSKTVFTKQALEKIGEGITPLEYMLSILRDENESPTNRFEAAKAAAPYVHPRLSQVDSTVMHKHDAVDYSREELIAIASGARDPGAGQRGRTAH